RDVYVTVGGGRGGHLRGKIAMSGKAYMERRKYKKERFYSAFSLYYHFVWVTKHREPMLVDKIKKDIGNLLIERCRDLNYHILEMAVMPEHVHLLLSLKPTDFLPKVATYLKGGVSRAFNISHEDCLDWTDGYSVDTVGKMGLQTVCEYIVRQREELKVKGLDWYLCTGHLEKELGWKE
ncbi:MAG: IS200/IS605 family transposase, partial [Candidatus Latescibacteria bacterium]|nr:IS200/IS605 family transposase [Candidatus Latescibacterota bacterium]